MNFEGVGVFYLGRPVAGGEPRPEPLLYQANDLTTHGLIVGMTGSGKTGLAISLLEEAALDGVPAIAIDPKGDLGNLLLSFPDLRPADFEPWIDPTDAQRRNVTIPERAAQVAEQWTRGLADWGQDGQRIARFREAVDLALYTPGMEAGRPLSVLKSFDPPAAETLDDPDAMRERVLGSVSGILALLGIEADPLRSREHILLSTILDLAWRSGKPLALADLVRLVIDPGIEQVGVLDLESFFPQRDRHALAMTLNNLLASPGFAAWTRGEPLDVGRLLYTDAGRPRLSVISIAHLSDAERMFFVTLLLEQVVSWVRTQPGTSSLRALLYMDEVFGFFPPVANPPAKLPMLTLLKQARAYGLGVVLATQNPVDLDYKGLSNCGSWFLGRLQTARDLQRVIDGLEGASHSAGHAFDRARVEATLAGLAPRQFLLNNVHEEAPVLFQTRWAMSYLRGPLTRAEVRQLASAKRPKEESSGDTQAQPALTSPRTVEVAAPQPGRPALPPDVEEVFVEPAVEGEVVYNAVLAAQIEAHWVHRASKLDAWGRVWLLTPLDAEWDQAEAFIDLPLTPGAREPASFAPLSDGIDAKRLKTATGRAKTVAKQRLSRVVYQCENLKEWSAPDETLADFRARLVLVQREARDEAIQAVEKRYEPKFARLRERIAAAEQRVAREEAQATQQQWDAATNIGGTLLGAIFGRRIFRGAKTAARSVSRTAKERSDIERAKADVQRLRTELSELDAAFQREMENVRYGAFDEPKITPVPVAPRAGDLHVRVVVAWVPWHNHASGAPRPAFRAREFPQPATE